MVEDIAVGTADVDVGVGEVEDVAGDVAGGVGEDVVATVDGEAATG